MTPRGTPVTDFLLPELMQLLGGPWLGRRWIGTSTITASARSAK